MGEADYTRRLQGALVEWRRWADAVLGGPRASDEDMRAEIYQMTVAAAPQARYAPVAVPSAALDAAERNPDIVRAIEESNERLIAFLKERWPPRSLHLPAPDYAEIRKSSDSSGFAYPSAAPLVMRGTFRIYFNRHGAAPLVWCVAPVLLGDHTGWELAVASVSIRTLVGTVYQPKATPDAEDGRPSAWIVATGVLTVRDGEAVIAGDATPEVQHP